jgi:hypothetical protein
VGVAAGADPTLVDSARTTRDEEERIANEREADETRMAP